MRQTKTKQAVNTTKLLLQIRLGSPWRGLASLTPPGEIASKLKF